MIRSPISCCFLCKLCLLIVFLVYEWLDALVEAPAGVWLYVFLRFKILFELRCLNVV